MHFYDYVVDVSDFIRVNLRPIALFRFILHSFLRFAINGFQDCIRSLSNLHVKTKESKKPDIEPASSAIGFQKRQYACKILQKIGFYERIYGQADADGRSCP